MPDHAIEHAVPRRWASRVAGRSPWPGLGVVGAAPILGLVAGGLTSSSAVAAVVLYRLISFGFIIGAGWLVWLAIRHRTHAAPAPAHR